MEKRKLLVIEDDELVWSQMKWALSEDYNLLFAADAERAIEILREEHPAVVTLDLGLPPRPDDSEEGLRLLGRILQHDPIVKVIVVSGNCDKAPAYKAVSHGAHDFFSKPINIDELKTILKRAYYVYSLEAEYHRLQRQLEHQTFDEIIGMSPKMQDIYTTVRKVGTTDVPVLVIGESGTGKELIARATHANSSRKSKPFIAINCGAIPDNLLESELFGHEKGAFTGAHMQRSGRIELAQGGTLFLDEIGELPPQLQVKMLRFLQDHKIERVGGRETINIDVRVIAATNRNLLKLTSEGKFREDLYYRLAVVTIELPPLRERGDDIILLAKSFLQKFSPDGNVKSLSMEADEAIRSYDWPGNVRELENRVRRAITFAEGNLIRPSDLGFGPQEEVMKQLDLKRAKEELEMKFVNMAMSKHNGNISKAAEELGLSRPTVHNIIKKINITK